MASQDPWEYGAPQQPLYPSSPYPASSLLNALANSVNAYTGAQRQKQHAQALAAALAPQPNIDTAGNAPNYVTPQIFGEHVNEPGNRVMARMLGGDYNKPAELDIMTKLSQSNDPAVQMLGAQAGIQSQIAAATKASEPFNLREGEKRFVGNTLVADNPKAQAGFSLNPDQVRYDATGKPIATGPAKPEDYNKPFLSNGQPNPAYQKFAIDERTAGRNLNNINLPPQQTEFEKGVGKVQSDRYKGIVDSADAARNKIQMLQTLGPALADAPFAGPAAETLTNAAMFAKQLGLDAADTTSAELARSLSNQMALMQRNPAGGAGLPGAMSDADRDYLKQTVPSMSNSRGGSQRMVEIATKIEQRKLDVATLAQAYIEQHHSLDSGFDKELKTWAEAHPLFTSAPGAAGAASPPQGGNIGGAPTATGPNGQKLVLQNGQWVPVK